MRKREMTRRAFLREAVAGAGAIALGGSAAAGRIQSEPSSRVVVAHHPGAAEGTRTVHREAVQRMLDQSLLELTGRPDIETAWRSLLPGLRSDHLVAVKVNTVSVCRVLPTHPEVVQAIVAGLRRTGLPEKQILVYDRETGHLAQAGYPVNQGRTGVRCFGTNEAGWGYETNHPVEILGEEYALSRILTRCDHLINVPVLKVHLDRYGVTLSLKNHYGTVDRPRDLHEPFPQACAQLNAQQAIRKKTRLVVIDALFGCWGSNPAAWVVDCRPNQLIASRDPVAADATGIQRLDAERARRGRPPRPVPFLREAERLGLGTADLERIDLREVNLRTG